MLTAIVIGSTGLTGKALVKQLLEDDAYSEVKTFSRRPLEIYHPKLTEHFIEFDYLDPWKEEVKGDVFFSCLGTNPKDTPTKEAFYKIDFTYQYEFARIASEQGIDRYVLVSAPWARSDSKGAYVQIKGQLEDAVKKLPFKSLCILQPSVLTGKREYPRKGEEVLAKIGHFLYKLSILKKYRPVSDLQIGQALANLGKLPSEQLPEYVVLDEIFKYTNAK
ncbi:MAG: NAD(P)H-binding protein [Bacteroidota bacterium]